MPKPNATAVFLLILWVLATSLVVMIVAPFAGALFAAAVVAGVLHPAQVWTSRRLGDRPALAAGLITGSAVLAVVIPLGLLGLEGGKQLADGVNQINLTIEREGVDGVIDSLPQPLRDPARALAERLPPSWLPRSEDREASPGDGRPQDPQPRERGAEAPDGGVPQRSQSSKGSDGPISVTMIASWVGRGLGIAMGLAVDIGVLVLGLYFLLAQGRRLVEWAVSVMPLDDTQSGELVGRLGDVNRAVFVATLGSALVQTMIAAVGYLIAGAPWLAATLLVTFIAALVPVIGGAAIVVAVGILTWMQGSTGYGVFLIAWGVLFVGLADNFVKPLIAERGTRLPSSILFFAMLGGISVFGPMGVVAGPLVLAFFVAILGLMRDQGWVNA